MRLTRHLNESKEIKSKIIKGLYGKVRVIEGYKDYKRLYVHKKGKFGYMVTDTEKVTLDDMIEIDGQFWFGTLKELHSAINEADMHHEDFFDSLMRMFKSWKRKDIFVWEVKDDLKKVVAALEIMKPINVRHDPPAYLFEFPGNNIVTAYQKTPNIVHIQRLSYKDFRKFFK